MISTPPGITTLSMKDNFAARSLSPIRPYRKYRYLLLVNLWCF
ncbi:Uncharacterised protein [Vibrio cholerae]|nr:Uncharacterised protein [Vibrio cholerae]